MDFYSSSSFYGNGRTRAFLKIQDGCNYVCSFCIIPQARGRSRTLDIEKIIFEVKKLVKNQFKEIVLTGVNLGEYQNTSKQSLSRLVSELSAFFLKGLKRLRLSSVEPNTMSLELLESLKNSSQFLDHFHIPLQSGSDVILTKMRRKYNVQEYRNIIARIKKQFSNAGIGADIIVGFPGESEKDFEQTYNLLEELPITHFHIFPYSKRKNTMASKMDNHIQSSLKKKRVHLLTTLGDQKIEKFSKGQVGQTSEVLFEKKNKDHLWEGYSSNFLKVYLRSKQYLHNQIKRVQLSNYRDGKLFGELLS